MSQTSVLLSNLSALNSIFAWYFYLLISTWPIPTDRSRRQISPQWRQYHGDLTGWQRYWWWQWLWHHVSSVQLGRPSSSYRLLSGPMRIILNPVKKLCARVRTVGIPDWLSRRVISGDWTISCRGCSRRQGRGGGISVRRLCHWLGWCRSAQRYRAGAR